MLPEIDALPSPKEEAGAVPGDQKGRLHQDRLDMTGHIIRSLVSVTKTFLMKGYQSLEKQLQIVTGAGVGILLNRQPR